MSPCVWCYEWQVHWTTLPVVRLIYCCDILPLHSGIVYDHITTYHLDLILFSLGFVTAGETNFSGELPVCSCLLLAWSSGCIQCMYSHQCCNLDILTHFLFYRRRLLLPDRGGGKQDGPAGGGADTAGTLSLPLSLPSSETGRRHTYTHRYRYIHRHRHRHRYRHRQEWRKRTALWWPGRDVEEFAPSVERFASPFPLSSQGLGGSGRRQEVVFGGNHTAVPSLLVESFLMRTRGDRLDGVCYELMSWLKLVILWWNCCYFCCWCCFCCSF